MRGLRRCRCGPAHAIDSTDLAEGPGCRGTVIPWSSNGPSHCPRRSTFRPARSVDEDGVSFSAWLFAAEHQLRIREGLRGVAAWEERAGDLTPEEIAAGEALLARLLSGVVAKVRPRGGCHGPPGWGGGEEATAVSAAANGRARSPRSGLVYGTAALGAAAKNDRLLWALHRAALVRGLVPVVPALAVAEAMRTAERARRRRWTC